MNFVCSLNFVDVNILVYLVRRPCTAGIVSFKKNHRKNILGISIIAEGLKYFCDFSSILLSIVNIGNIGFIKFHYFRNA